MNKIQIDLMGAMNTSLPVRNSVNEKIKELERDGNHDFHKDVSQFYEQRDDILTAIKQGNLSIDETLHKLIESRVTDTLVRAYIDQFFERNKPDEAALKSAYQHYVKSVKGTDYELSILTCRSRAEAQKVCAEFNKGRCFGELATRYSISDTSRTGGYVGWVSDSWLSPLTNDVLRKMRTGQCSDPIQAEEGFHVLYFENIRPSAPSSFVDIKAQLEIEIISKQFDQHLHILHHQRNN